MVHTYATKIRENVLKIGNLEFLEQLIDSKIDITLIKAIYGDKNPVHVAK